MDLSIKLNTLIKGQVNIQFRTGTAFLIKEVVPILNCTLTWPFIKVFSFIDKSAVYNT